MTRRLFASAGLLAGISLRLSAETTKPAPAAAPAIDPEAVLRELREGNQRFLAGHSIHPHNTLDWAVKTAKEGQHPRAVVLCCSDSRVSPELVFDQGLGDLFVVRVAGNVANEDEIASIEYATEHLHVPLVVVLGHSQCGAVSAVVEGGELPREIRNLTHHIEHAMGTARSHYPQRQGPALIETTVRENVGESIHTITSSGGGLAHQVAARQVRVEGAVYELNSGHVTWLPELSTQNRASHEAAPRMVARVEPSPDDWRDTL